MPELKALLDASQFDGLAITKTPAGYSVSTYSDGSGWSADVTRATAGEALLAMLVGLPPCPVALPPCPVPLP